MNKLFKNASAGFSLVEVLVALVILSVGMLGILTLQVKSLQFSQTAMSNTQAVILSGDMIDRIRANANGTASYDDVDFGAPGNMPSPVCSDIDATTTVTAICTPQALAAFDIWQWKSSLQQASLLPNADGSIDVADDGRNVTITVQWTEQGATKDHDVRFAL